ncbi:hypothetical protein [Streptomyces sp. NPDC056361]|uniref:hypothetical protein n=1 Tax=Streptomyces sp. NPDC056361 TaxID=3345795 RepID=UPI0035DC7E49
MVVVDTEHRSGGSGMERLGRWTIAGLATIVGFAMPTWLGGAVVLPSVLEVAEIRWAVASALGTAVAALVGMWGYRFATRSREHVPGPVVQATGGRAVAIGGPNSGAVSTGDTGAGQPGAPATDGSRSPAPPSARPAPGTVAATGERSIAIGGDNTGTLSTGDRHDGAPS